MGGGLKGGENTGTPACMPRGCSLIRRMGPHIWRKGHSRCHVWGPSQGAREVSRADRIAGLAICLLGAGERREPD